MQTLKEQAIKAISKLPDEAELEDIMYRLYVLDQIRKGEEAIDKGEFISVEELEKEMAKW